MSTLLKLLVKEKRQESDLEYESTGGEEENPGIPGLTPLAYTCKVLNPAKADPNKQNNVCIPIISTKSKKVSFELIEG